MACFSYVFRQEFHEAFWKLITLRTINFYKVVSEGVDLKKVLRIITLTFVLLLTILQTSILAVPSLSAKAAILIDAQTGRVLYEKNAHERLPQASTTKITTALLALENGELSQEIIIPEDFKNPGEAGIWLEPGEKHTLEDLLYALMLRSANDAAAAIAIGVGGSEEKFIDMMNKRVHELGLEDTNYANPHGLHNSEHYSSAYDLSIIAREALKHEEFQKIIVTKKHFLPWPGHDYDRVVYNRNKLLGEYDGADGVKNGYTKQAGNCLVSSATRDGVRLIAVVLNAHQMYDEVANLFDYGFKTFNATSLVSQGEVIKNILVEGGTREQLKVIAANEATVLLKDSEVSKITRKVELPEKINAPIQNGQKVGSLVLAIDNKSTMTVDLIAAENIERKSIFTSIWEMFFRVFDVFLV